MDLQGGDSSNRLPNAHHRNPFSRRRNLKELLHLTDDDSGYIEGRVFMAWPPRNKFHHINFEVAEDSALYRFELMVLHKDGIAFQAHERICFALQGAKVDPRGQSSAPHYFPIILRYPKGVVLKYLTGVNVGKVVDTWAENTDEWYNPWMVSDVITTGASETRHGPVSTAANSVPPQGVHRHGGTKIDRVPPPLTTATDNVGAAQPVRSVQQPSTEKFSGPSKTRARKKRRLMKKAQESAFFNRPTDDTDTSRRDVTMLSREQGSLAGVSDSHQERTRYAEENVSVLKDSDLSRENACSNIPEQVTVPAPQLKAGFRTERGDIFTALSNLQKDSTINVIGVVTSANAERKTKTNEWCRAFTLTDPSTFGSPQQDVKVNCFQKKYTEWLPQVEMEDIVILRRLKVVEFSGALSTTGYNDKLRWAVYNPSKHSIRPPNRGNAPEKELLDDGLGYEFSPFWEPFQDSTELEYCRQIGEWWQAMHKSEGGKVSTVVCSPPPRRQHLLISEASPDRPPKGFFNCTVEVLHKFNNQGSPMTTIYVTDYTTNSLVHAEQGAWCSPELFGRVLQCNMWDDAKELAKMMNTGEYWYLNNIRARQNPNGHMEGTMQLAEKVVRLDEANLEAQPQLQALLERKKEFECNKSTCGPASSHVFPHMLVQDVEMSTNFLTCVVEMLHVDFDSPDGHFIFVTDYTFNPDLPAAVSSAEWADKLEHRVVKIKLDEAQAKLAPNLKPGCRYTVRNLRIKHSSVFGGVHGYLGGEEELIVYLDDSSSHDAQTLQRNKEKWNRELMLNVPTTLHRESDEPSSRSLTTLSTLEELLSRPAPNVYKVLARTVDFFPFSLSDACVLRCTKCESSPPRCFKGCPRCDNMMETHCKWFYCVYISLKDEKGTELIVSLSGKECALLQDIEPTDFGCDRVAFNKFQEKLDPILGNLREVHAAWSKNEDKTVESPLMTFTIESWNVGDEKGYGLLYCTPT